MSFEELILVIISGLGVFHGVFFALILWSTKTAHGISNRILGILMLLLSLRIGKSVALAFSKELEIIYIYLGLCLLLFIGPLFYLYSRTLIYKERRLQKADLIHFFPAVLFFLLSVPFQIMGFKRIPDLLTGFMFLVFYGHFLTYLISTRLKYINRDGEEQSVPVLKSWLQILFYGLLLIWVVYVLNLFEDRIPYIIGPIVYSVIVYTITYLAISRKYLLLVNTVKYATTSMPAPEVDALFESINKAVQEHQLFLQPDVSLASLARRLKASPQKISLAINSKAGCNFNEYVNRLRIAYAMQLLRKPETKELTIAAIATDAGFNSLSSFNQAFRKVTGKTPSAFRKVAS